VENHDIQQIFGPEGSGCCNFYCIKIKMYVTVILLVVQVCGYETWSVTLRNRLVREDWYWQKCIALGGLHEPGSPVKTSRFLKFIMPAGHFSSVQVCLSE